MGDGLYFKNEDGGREQCQETQSGTPVMERQARGSRSRDPILCSHFISVSPVLSSKPSFLFFIPYVEWCLSLLREQGESPCPWTSLRLEAEMEQPFWEDQNLGLQGWGLKKRSGTDGWRDSHCFCSDWIKNESNNFSLLAPMFSDSFSISVSSVQGGTFRNSCFPQLSLDGLCPWASIQPRDKWSQRYRRQGIHVAWGSTQSQKLALFPCLQIKRKKKKRKKKNSPRSKSLLIKKKKRESIILIHSYSVSPIRSPKSPKIFYQP